MPRDRDRTSPLGISLMLASLLVGAPLLGACASRSPTGELTPPSDARAWEGKWRPAFDDDYTAEAINLQGRAPHDVRDQRLLALRMGHADLVAEVRVLQVWGRGRYQGRQDQYLEVAIEQYLIGQPVKGTADEQLIRVVSEDELPGSLQGQSLVLFVRWDAGEQPPYHHHLMPMDAEAIGFMAARIEHAKREGVLNDQGVATEKPGKRKRKKKKAKAKKKAKDTSAATLSGHQPRGA